MMLAVGDLVWQAAIAGVVTVAMALIGMSATRAANRAAIAAAKVREDLKESNDVTSIKLDDLAKNGEKIHTLVNSNMEAQMKISAVALRTVANLNPSAETEAAANLAEKLLREHQGKQASVDAKEKNCITHHQGGITSR